MRSCGWSLSNPPANALSRAVIDELQAALEAGPQRPRGARHRHRRDRQGLFGRPRSQGDDGAPQRSRSRPGVLRRNHGRLLGADAVDRHASEAGDRRGRRAGNRRRAATGRQLRPRDRFATAPPSARRASISACSARRRWWRCRATSSRKQAMEMLLTGETIDAATARGFGLVNRVVPPEYLTQIVSKYAQTIASKSSLTLKIGKEAFYRQAEMSLADAYRYASEVMVENMLARDAEEGIGAFLGQARSRMDRRMMEPRVSIITLGVGDLDRAVAFYEAMGLVRSQAITDGVAFFQMGGSILGAVAARRARQGCRRRRCSAGRVRRRRARLQHALRRRGRRGAGRGREGRRPHRQAGGPGLLGRLVRLFRRQRRPSLGGRAQPGIPDRRRRQRSRCRA